MNRALGLERRTRTLRILGLVLDAVVVFFIGVLFSIPLILAALAVSRGEYSYELVLGVLATSFLAVYAYIEYISESRG